MASEAWGAEALSVNASAAGAARIDIGGVTRRKWNYARLLERV
jgi:hypothetical protein